jgi:hypothetical protein
MHLSAFDRLLWATGFVGQGILLSVLFARGRAKSFHIFTTMVARTFIGTAILYFVFTYGSHRAYYDGYWISGTLDMLLQLGVVYEIARHVFAPLGQWAPDIRRSFIQLVGSSIVVDIVLTALASPAKRSAMETVIARGTFFSSMLMAELFVGLVALSATAGLPWRTHVARIAQGQGAYSFVGILFDITTSWMGWAHQANVIHTLTQVRIGGYLCVLTYWIGTLWQEAPESRALSDSVRGQIFQLNRQIEYDLGRIRGWRKI